MAIDDRLAAAQESVARLYREMRREAEEPLERLQQASRWLRHAESLAQWVESLAEAGSSFAASVIVFAIESDNAVVKAARGLHGTPGTPTTGTPTTDTKTTDPQITAASLVGRSFPLASSPALKQAAQSGEVVVCLRAPSQIPFAVLEAIGPSAERRGFVLPVPGRNRVVGLLYAEGHVRLSALETLAALAAGSLLLRNPASAKNTVSAGDLPEAAAPTQGGTNQLLSIAPAPLAANGSAPSGNAPTNASSTSSPSTTSSSHAALPASDGSLSPQTLSPQSLASLPLQLAPAMLPARLEARRFARMWITKMVLENPADVVQGRQAKNLFARFRVKIEEGRREYAQRLLPGDSADENYFNEELVRQLAQGDPSLLGEELPV